MLSASAIRTAYGRIEAVRGITLDLPDGAIVALIGANGAGKSTLMNTLSGVLRPVGGTVKLAGQDITGLPSHKVARRGLIQVPEGRQVLGPMTVKENLELGREALGSRARRSDDLERVFALFPRLRERVGQRAGSLSGGEQQMLAIGRALMGRPTVLMLDEPSLGLAPVVVTQVFEALRLLNADGLTMLLVEQNARRALDLADYAYVIERGRVFREGPSEQLRRDPEIQRSFLGGHD
jgi:branched-chain amino acid transport system ATP-binding protein